MSNIALYRKYRGTSFDDIKGQDHVVEPLKRSIDSGKISHAYLLSGPRGVGKTSIARIIAHEINKLPYKLGESSHVDIIEIDAASNRRIDEIRDLREKVHIAPLNADYKVYIIDEVHMLTKEAFNALLKTLEEPPAHAVFILATTEIHKLPATIVSRTQRHQFKPVPEETLAEQLQTIAKNEKLKLTDEAFKLLAQHGEGSFRDAISLLDQLSAHAADKTVDETAVRRLLGLPASDLINRLRDAVLEGNNPVVATTLDDLKTQGTGAVMIAEQLIRALRRHLKFDTAGAETVLLLIERLLEIAPSRSPEILLETVLHRAAISAGSSAPDTLPETRNPQSQTSSKPAKAPVSAAPEPKTKPTDNVNPKNNSMTQSRALEAESWKTILESIKRQNNALYAVLRMGTPAISADVLTVSFRYPFHASRAAESKNKRLLQTIAGDVLSRTLSVEAQVDTSLEATPTSDDSSKVPETVFSTFGGGEVVDFNE